MTCHEVALQFDSRGETEISKAAPPLPGLNKGRILIMNQTYEHCGCVAGVNG